MPSGGRLQIGTMAGFKSERVAGFKLERMAGFIGICRQGRPRRLIWTPAYLQLIAPRNPFVSSKPAAQQQRDDHDTGKNIPQDQKTRPLLNRDHPADARGQVHDA